MIETLEKIEVKMCSKCIIDSHDDPTIQFDENGVCNNCKSYEQKWKPYNISPTERAAKLKTIIDEIKLAGKNKKYDCIIGVSGGVDSTYLVYQLKKMELRPLVIHFDNGWNSELAVKNIENILSKLGFDLYTYVVNWDEFKDLQLSYIKASVIDWEMPTDHGFMAMLFEQAARYDIKYILSGHNIVTEGIMLKNFRWSKLDVANIKSIHDTYGKIKLKTFPLLNFSKYVYYTMVKKMKFVSPLNYMDYDKAAAKNIIEKELNWRDYGGKHYESIFTRFYQGYVLIEKFKVDKRKVHLSTLINSGQITRAQALEEMKKPAYDHDQYLQDREYVLKKLGLTEEEFTQYMKQPNRSHLDFKSYETGLYRQHEKFFKSISPVTKLVKKLYKVVKN